MPLLLFIRACPGIFPHLAARLSVILLLVKTIESSGSPVALYDDLQNRPFLEYPDGRRVYDID